jgi:uncharacterized surface protein with fasciclin (FAS1) repeats
MRPVRLLLVAGAAAALAGPAGASGAMPPPHHRETAPAVQGDVIATLRARGQYVSFLRLVDAAGLTRLLRESPAVTVFAPTDPVFEALPADAVERLRVADRTRLRRLVLNHVVGGRLARGDLRRSGELRTAAGTVVAVHADGDRIKVDGAAVTEADIPATNGTIFAVDRLLLPFR